MKTRTNRIAPMTCLLISLAMGSLGTQSVDASLFSSSKKHLQIRTTAYTHTESDHIEYGRQTAAGTRLKAGKVNSAAADWSFMPLGTTFRIKGDPTLYRVEDYGSALVGTETVDIYRPCHNTMNKWGVRNVEIQIVRIGSVKRSIDLLEGRVHHEHCRTMLEKLQEKS